MTEGVAEQWYLLRAAVLVVGDPPQTFHFRLRNGDTVTEALTMASVEGKPLGMLAIARVPLDAQPLPGQTYRVPDDRRRRAEAALEFVARLVALEHGTTHGIVSPRPCIGVYCTETSMMDAVEGTPVALPGNNAAMVGVGHAGLITDGAQLALLQDRLDGVVMLTEALNARSPVGQFTQFWRFFERAFHRGHRKAAPLITDLLSGGPHGFEQSEIGEWVNKRNPAVHADRHQAPTLDSDVQGLVGRMREAAYDVLLNKEQWAVPSASRRDAWRPPAGSSDRSGSIFGVPGRAWTLQAQLLDDFASFPLMLAGPVEDALPAACWLLPDDETGPLLRRRGSGALDLD